MLILALAGFVIDRARRTSEVRRTARLLLLGRVPAAIVFVQPDLGTGTGLRGDHARDPVHRRRPLDALRCARRPLPRRSVAIVLVIAPAIGKPILQAYQQDRLTPFLNPSEDPRRLLLSDQTVDDRRRIRRQDRPRRRRDTGAAGFLPERHTDFIFAVVAERWGFVGAAFLLSLYALLIWRALRIMTLSKNLYGSMVAGGIAAMLCSRSSSTSA